MAFLATALNGIGLILLTHAVYSTHEHTALHPTQTSLPTDITVELLISIVILSTGIVLGTSELKPIKWSTWAGKIEREGRKGEGWTREGEEILSEGDPFKGLVEGGRRGFWDVRAKRKEFADWVRDGGKS